MIRGKKIKELRIGLDLIQQHQDGFKGNCQYVKFEVIDKAKESRLKVLDNTATIQTLSNISEAPR